MEKFSVKKFHYDEKYSEQLRFKCNFCGARVGQACIAMSQLICEPHTNRWDKARAKADKLRKVEEEFTAMQVDSFQEWLRG